MNKILAMLLCMAPLCAEEIQNRFQISISNGDKPEVFVLDQKTGNVWTTEKKFIGNDYKEWRQLPPLPYIE